MDVWAFYNIKPFLAKYIKTIEYEKKLASKREWVLALFETFILGSVASTIAAISCNPLGNKGSNPTVTILTSNEEWKFSKIL